MDMWPVGSQKSDNLEYIDTNRFIPLPNRGYYSVYDAMQKLPIYI